MGLSTEELLKMYKMMILVRHFDERIPDLIKQGHMRGFSHQCIGQEAIAVGACSVLKEQDYITSTHRGHGQVIAKGAGLVETISELLGRTNGICGGRGGSMHLACLSKGAVGGNGIVGGNFPIAVGFALSAKKRGTDQITLCFFGDGASNQGTFHESINLASLWKLPVIFFCENNKYGMTTSVTKSMAQLEVAKRGVAYNVESKVIDGNDLEEVYASVQEAAAYTRSGKGPYLLEALTYRHKGHSVNDPGTAYRPAEEIDEWMNKCPIKRMKEKLLTKGVSEETIIALEKEAVTEYEEALKVALNSPIPESTRALDFVYA